VSTLLTPPLRPTLERYSVLKDALSDRKDQKKTWCSRPVAPRATLLSKRYVPLNKSSKTVTRVTLEGKTYSVGPKAITGFVPPDELVKKKSEKSLLISRLTSLLFFKKKILLLNGAIPKSFKLFYLRKFPMLRSCEREKPKHWHVVRSILRLLFLMKETVLSNRIRREVTRFLVQVVYRPLSQARAWYHFLLRKFWLLYCNPKLSQSGKLSDISPPAKHWCCNFLPRQGETALSRTHFNVRSISCLIVEPQIVVREWDNPTVFRFKTGIHA
jgi:hypothetical protein